MMQHPSAPNAVAIVIEAIHGTHDRAVRPLNKAMTAYPPLAGNGRQILSEMQ